MKNLYVVILFLICTTNAQAQWQICFQDTALVSCAVVFVNPDTGFVSARHRYGYGIMIYTYDGGATWNTSQTGGNGLLDVSFANDSVGYTGGIDAAVYKTIDAGKSWVQKTFVIVPADYSTLFFLNNDTGFVQEFGGAIFRTNDGGDHWSWITSGVGNSTFIAASQIFFTDDTTGYVAGGGVYKTIDGGFSWQNLNIDTNMHALAFQMINSNHGVAVGLDGKVTVTLNGGSSWTTPDSLCMYPLHDVLFLNDSIGYIVGGSDPYSGPYYGMNYYRRGVIFYTHDGGFSWTLQDSSFNYCLYSIAFTDNQTGFIAGDYGHILKTTNGGLADISSIEKQNNNLKIYPNPVKGNCQISYVLAQNSVVTMKLFNALGQQKIIFFKEKQSAGEHHVNINTEFLPAGFYFIKHTTNGYSALQKFVILK